MDKVTVTIEVTMEQLNSLQKAPIFLQHYGSTELNADLIAIWKAIGKAALSAIK